jgi:16S rRNA (adenine1518-N6/adenine1519-N6)-dimethyltransferase
MSDTPYIKAKKSLGQNFLIDEDALFDIAHSVVVEGKNIIEVGPGYGALTDYLIEQTPETLTLVELDTDMIEILQKKYTTDIAILHQDVLQFVPVFSQYSVIANIPYYITSPILFHFLYADDFTPPESMVIMMQEEVGEKILE